MRALPSALGICLLAPTVALAQDNLNPPSTFNRAAYGAIKNICLHSAEKMPEENYSFKPSDAVGSYGHLTAHHFAGNVMVHEMKEAGTADDPARHDHPFTMFYLDSDRLLLTHYCDAWNRPRMSGKMSPDGKTVEFDFLDLSGGTQYGHMDHAVFTFVDANHHTEDWTYIMPGDKPVQAHFEPARTK